MPGNDTYAAKIANAEAAFNAIVAANGDYPEYKPGMAEQWPFLHCRFCMLMFRMYRRLGYIAPNAGGFHDVYVTDDYGNLQSSSVKAMLHYCKQGE